MMRCAPGRAGPGGSRYGPRSSSTSQLGAESASHQGAVARHPRVREGEVMNILVTGGSGFVGKAVVRELRRAGHEVTILTRRPASGPVQSGITLVRGDLTSAGAIADLIAEHGFD